MWRIIWFFRKRGIDRKIAQDKPITKQEAYLIIKRAIQLHERYPDDSWFNPILSDGKTWVWNYQQIIALIYGYLSSLTRQQAIDKLIYDVYTHQYYIDNPEEAVGSIGSVAHQKKWKARWLAILILIQGMK